MATDKRVLAYAILSALLLWFVFTAFGAWRKRPIYERVRNRNALSHLCKAVCLYAEEYDALPPETASLLVDSRGVHWTRQVLDAWGNPLLYRVSSAGETGEYAEIRCTGRDGSPGGEGADRDFGYVLRHVPGLAGKLEVTQIPAMPD